MRNHDFVSDGFLALIVTCLLVLCSIALLVRLWRTSSPPKPLVTFKSLLRSMMYAERLDAIPFNDASRFEAIRPRWRSK